MSIFKKIKDLFTKGEKTTLQRQARAGIILLALVIVGLVVYFAIILPATKQKSEYVPKLYDGEGFYEFGGVTYTDVILMEKQRSRADVVSIEVKNDSESYKLVAKDPGNAGTQFYIEGAEKVALETNNVVSFVTNAVVLSTNSPAIGVDDRVNDRATNEDLVNYGLDGASSPARITVTLVDGGAYTLIIGDKQPTSAGYYAMIDGRVNAVDGAEYKIVYSLTSHIGDALKNSPSASLVSNTVLPYFGNAAYSPTHFLISHSDDEGYYKIFEMGSKSEDDAVASGESYELLYPRGYYVNENILSSYVVNNFSYLTATQTLAYGKAAHTDEMLEKYGLDLNASRLINGTEKCRAKVLFEFDSTATGGSFPEGSYTIYFGNTYYDSSLGAEYRYAYSPYSDTVFTVPASSFAFVSWHTVRFISPLLYSGYITSLDYIQLTGAGADVRYTLTGNYMNYHIDVTLSGDNAAKLSRDGKVLTFDASPRVIAAGSTTRTIFEGEFENFRSFYYVLITREYALDADISAKYSVSDAPSRVIEIKTTERDNNGSFFRFDKNGQKMLDENGETIEVMYNGGHIRCKNGVLTTKSGQTVNYDVLFFNDTNGKFFRKELDIADYIEKPQNYKIDESGHLSDWTYLGGTVTAEYSEKVQTYNIYDVVYDYTDIDGNTTQQINQTYCYVVPTVTVYKYKLTSDGTNVTRELIGEPEVEVSDGVYMRTTQLNKLYSDSNKLLSGVEISKFSPN